MTTSLSPEPPDPKLKAISQYRAMRAVHTVMGRVTKDRDPIVAILSRAIEAETKDPDPPSETTSRAPTSQEARHASHVYPVPGCPRCYGEGQLPCDPA